MNPNLKQPRFYLIQLLGVCHKDECSINDECETHVLIKFHVNTNQPYYNQKNEWDDTVVVKRIITTQGKTYLKDDFLYSVRENYDDVNNDWVTKEEYGSPVCDWLEYIHRRIDKVLENGYDYYLGSDDKINKDNGMFSLLDKIRNEEF